MGLEKAAIFVDGGYLAKILKEQFNEARINFDKLGSEISDTVKVKRLRTYYYTCEPLVRKDNPDDIKRQASFQKFLSNIKRGSKFDVKLGKLQYIKGAFKQKMIDVLMSLDIANMTYRNQIHYVILVAGDSDFAPAIKTAKDNGATIHLFYHPSSVHNEILDHVDERYTIEQILIDKTKIND